MIEDAESDDDRSIFELLSATDRGAERWRIVAYAGRQREKFGCAETRTLPGLAARRHQDWFEIAAKLADIQADYDAHPGSHAPHLYRRALMILWPILLDPIEFRKRPKTNRRERLDREKLFGPLFALSILSMKRMHDGNPFRSTPRLIVRRRTRGEKTPESQEMLRERRHGEEDEIVGRAVLQAYVKMSPRNLNSAYTEIADVGEVGGIPTGGFDNVRLRYLRYRKLAHERGFADSRAFACEFQREPWPLDQVWLQDFPAAKAANGRV